MKLKFLKALILSFLSFQALQAEEKPIESYSYWDFHPLHAGGNGLAIAKAELSDPNPGNVLFNKENVFLYMLVPISRTSYFIPRVEWNTFQMEWDRNPKFNQSRFQYVQFALTFYSTALEKWKWILRADYNADQDHFCSSSYGLFSALAWGAYEIHRKWHYHVGFLGYRGMRGGWIYPVIGLDFAPNKKWRFQFIFPIDYSIQYNIGNWRLSLKGRPLRERFRVGPNEPQPRSIFNYSSFGTEFNVHYERFLRLEVEAFAGYNWGGTLYIKNKIGKQAFYTNFGGALYGGISLNYGF